MKDIIVIGGGLAGLISAIKLSRQGYQVLLIEKKKYPFHRVCGEYISNEVKPYLEKEGLFPSALNPSSINKFWLTSVSGKKAVLPLEMGGFGISRYAFDQYLVNIATDTGVQLCLGDAVLECSFDDDHFKVQSAKGDRYEAKYVIGAFGKRSILDKHLKRPFIQKKSPYVGVKYHIKTDFPQDVIALHNFDGGYCGISKVEDDMYNLCYLSHRDNLRKCGNIPAMEEMMMWKNPHLKALYANSEFVFKTPEVINEISFEKKQPVVDHILMVGDTAGLITPLCGNGMAMAIHSAKILSDILIDHDLSDRSTIEAVYAQRWRGMFERRLWTGRVIQNLFGSEILSNVAVSIAKTTRPLASLLIEATHGKVF